MDLLLVRTDLKLAETKMTENNFYFPSKDY